MNQLPPHPARLDRVRSWLRSDMRVLRWVFLALYLLLLIGLSVPWILAGDAAVPWAILAGTILVSQALFIFGGGTIHLCFPIQHRRLWMPVLAASFMLGLLGFGLALALLELFRADELFSQPVGIGLFWLLVLGNWAFWGLLLWVYVRRRERMGALWRLAGACFAGSLAELLAAVPSHIIVSRRPGCLVGLFTMMGIVAGIEVMLFSFGPMIVLLFLRPRYRREQMETAHFCRSCWYDLTGTLMAGRTECPECGAKVATADR